MTISSSVFCARRPGSGGEQVYNDRVPAWRGAALLLAVLALQLTACATTGSPYGDLDRYIGRPLESVKADFGPGFREFVAPDGRRTATWSWQSADTVTGYRPPVVRMGRGAAVTVGPDPSGAAGGSGMAFCEYTFFATAGGTVDGWQAFGPACQGAGGTGIR